MGETKKNPQWSFPSSPKQKGKKDSWSQVKTTSREQSMKIKNKIKHTLFKLNKNNVYLNMSFILVKIQAAQMKRHSKHLRQQIKNLAV